MFTFLFNQESRPANFPNSEKAKTIDRKMDERNISQSKRSSWNNMEGS